MTQHRPSNVDSSLSPPSFLAAVAEGGQQRCAEHEGGAQPCDGAHDFVLGVQRDTGEHRCKQGGHGVDHLQEAPATRIQGSELGWQFMCVSSGVMA